MSLRALRTLQAIARHGSFAAAGKAVGLTQSAVSLQVKVLEEEFGAPLFDRSRRLPVLTEAGRTSAYAVHPAFQVPDLWWAHVIYELRHRGATASKGAMPSPAKGQP